MLPLKLVMKFLALLILPRWNRNSSQPSRAPLSEEDQVAVKLRTRHHVQVYPNQATSPTYPLPASLPHTHTSTPLNHLSSRKISQCARFSIPLRSWRHVDWHPATVPDIYTHCLCTESIYGNFKCQTFYVIA